MKAFIAILIFLNSTAALARNDIDYKAIYLALNTTETAGVEPHSNYKYWIKRLIGFVTCKKYDFAGDAYTCYFGGIEGYSMAKVAYHSLNVKEKLVSSDRIGKTYKKEVGGLVCTKIVYNKPFIYQGDILIRETSKCEVSLTFGRFITP